MSFVSSRNIIFRFLDTDGDGSGTVEATGDYSETPEIFFIQPPVGQRYVITRMIVMIQDTPGFAAAGYGDFAALSNGVTIRVQDPDETLADFTFGLPITANSHWGRFCFDVDVKTWGSGNDILVARWTFSKAGIPGIYLSGTRQERLEVVLNDDLTGLVSHTFYVNGYKA